MRTEFICHFIVTTALRTEITDSRFASQFSFTWGQGKRKGICISMQD